MQELSTPSDKQPKPPAGADAIGDVIAKLWDRVLERGPDARGASILDLKVGALRVHRLFEEIKQATGVDLPITAMFQAPTLEQIIELVRLGRAPAAEALAELKKGGGSPPLFIFPGMGGIALELAELARLIRYDGPIYANQPRGLIRGETPHLSVAEMADYQVAVIRGVQPHGPYRLAGYSFGGLVALEVARRLQESGETVDFLGLIEPSLSERNWPKSARAGFVFRRLKHHAAALLELPPWKIAPYMASHARAVFERLRRLLGAKDAGVSPYHREGLPAGLAETRAAGNAAFFGYRLAPYRGKATLLCSERGDALGCDARLIYPGFLEQCDMLQCGGDHAAMLRQPYVQELAENITRCLAALAQIHSPSRASGTEGRL